LPQIDLLPLALANVGDIEIAKAAVKARPPWIAQADGKNLVRARCCSGIRIASGNCIIARGVTRKRVGIDVEPKDVAGQVIVSCAAFGVLPPSPTAA
jgi:hypothetical protein